MAATEIPETAEGITPELLSSVFAKAYPGAEARSVEIVDAHSGTTGRARLRVAWAASGAPEAVFAKLAPTDPIQREMVVATGMGRREARFYAEVASSVPVRIAQPYASLWNDDGSRYLMLIEDLGESGCTFPSWKSENLDAHARAMMDSLARLHAHFLDSPRFERELAWIEPPMRSEIGPLLVRSSVEQFGDEMPRPFHEMAEIYLDHTEPLCERVDAGTQTLIHGDSHLGNLLLDGDEIGFLDWACTARAPGVRDVAYFLSNSVPTDLRRREERSLLERYLAGLAACGVEAPSFDQAWLQYRLCAACGWIAATATAAAGSRMQAIEIGMRSMKRSTEAIADLSTPELFRAELGIG